MGSDALFGHAGVHTDRAFIYIKYINKSKKLIKKLNNPIKKWSTDLNKEFSTEESQVTEVNLRNP